MSFLLFDINVCMLYAGFLIPATVMRLTKSTFCKLEAKGESTSFYHKCFSMLTLEMLVLYVKNFLRSLGKVPIHCQ